MSQVGESSNVASSSQVQITQEINATHITSCKPTIPKKRKISKPRSEVWDHFTKYNTNDGEKMSKCNYCGKIYHSDTKVNGTTNLRTHLSNCQKNPQNFQSKQAQLILQSGGKGDESVGTLKSWRFDQENVRKSLAAMVILDELPFKHVEGWGFKYFMSQCCPMFQIPSRWTLTRDCFQFYLDERVILKKVFKDSCRRVCLTTDTWTSIQRMNYMCLTAHYIDDDWKLHKKLINFCPIFSHRGDLVGQQVEKCLVEWGIDSIFTVTVDNASSNNGIISHLQKKFAKRGGSILEGKFLHMRCVAHIINLIVQDGIKEVGHSVQRVRAFVRYIRQSPARLQKFKECADIEKIQSKNMLCLDVPTRWNSTYLMLNVAQKFERAFERYEEIDNQFKDELDKACEESQDPSGVPTEIDWDNVRRLVSFLEKFYELTLRISGSLYVTSNTFFHEIAEVLCVLQSWEVDNNPDVRNMAKKMKQKFDKYWGNIEKMNLNIFLAVVVDPRFKLRYVEFAVMSMYEGSDDIDLAQMIRKTCYDMFYDYKLKVLGQNKNENTSTDSVGLIEGPSDLKDGGRRYMMVEKFKKSNFGKDELDNKTDLDKYLVEESEPMRDGFDILAWWKINAPRFPILSQMAQDILAVPISTVASESAFSTGGRVLDAFRSSLSPRIVQALICTQDWMRAKWTNDPVKVEENFCDVDKFDEDLSKLTNEATIW